jgi:hypothetical protein
MHLSTQPVHLFPCSNYKTNRILYHDIASQTIIETPLISLLEPGIPDCRLLRMFSTRKRKLLLMRRAWKTTHLSISRARFHLSDVHVLWSWHLRLHIWALVSVISDVAIATLPRLLHLWSSCQTVFVKTGSSRWIFSSAVTCAATGCDFSQQSFSVYDDLFLSVLNFAHCSSLTLSSRDSCMPTKH